MRLTIRVEFDPGECPSGQPSQATVVVGLRYADDLLSAASVEAANPYLPAEWRDCTAAIVAARVLAAGLRVGVRNVMDEATVSAAPVEPVLGEA